VRPLFCLVLIEEEIARLRDKVRSPIIQKAMSLKYENLIPGTRNRIPEIRNLKPEPVETWSAPHTPAPHTPEPLNPKSNARSPEPEARDPKLLRACEARPASPNPETRNPKPEIRKPKSENRNPKPGTRNPKPETLSPRLPRPVVRECAESGSPDASHIINPQPYTRGYTRTRWLR